MSPVAGSVSADAARVRAQVTVPVRATIFWLIGISAALALAYLAVNTLATLDIITYEGRLVGAFDMDAEGSIPAWFSVLLLFGNALVLAMIACATPPGRQRRWWTIFAVGFVVLSMDEGAALHESLMYTMRNLLHITGGVFWYAWVIPIGIGLLVAAPFVIRFVLSLPRRTCVLLICAAVIFATGAIGIEMLSATTGAEVEAFARDEHDSAVWLLAFVEESLELTGLIVMSAATLTHLRDHTLRRGEVAVRLI